MLLFYETLRVSSSLSCLFNIVCMHNFHNYSSNYRKANASSSLCENPPPCLIRIWLSELKPAAKRALFFISLITMKFSSLLLLASKILSMSKLLLDTRYCNCYVALINLYILCENVLRVNRKNKCVREVMKLKMYYCIQIKLGIYQELLIIAKFIFWA